MGHQSRRHDLHLPSDRRTHASNPASRSPPRTWNSRFAGSSPSTDPRLHHHPVRVHQGQYGAADPRHRRATVVMQLPTQQAPSFVLYCLSANVGCIVEKATAMAHAENDDMGNGWLKTHTAGAGASSSRRGRRRTTSSSMPTRNSASQGGREAHRAATRQGPGRAVAAAAARAASISRATCRPISSSRSPTARTSTPSRRAADVDTSP